MWLTLCRSWMLRRRLCGSLVICIFISIMEFCFSHDTNIRIDTHRDNKIMQHNILKHGFTYCGIIYLLSGDERLAYQKNECL